MRLESKIVDEGGLFRLAFACVCARSRQRVCVDRCAADLERSSRLALGDPVNQAITSISWPVVAVAEPFGISLNDVARKGESLARLSETVKSG